MTPEPAEGPGPFTVISGNPTPGELAAVSAVVEAALQELGDGDGEITPIPSAWQQSQRAIRRPIHPGLGAWRGFSA